MNVNEILLINFRNYSKEKIKFNKNINIIVGDNAQGKTNILESIYFLSITKSYKTNDEKNLILHGENFFKVSGKIKNDKIIKKLSIQYEKNKKKVFINDNCIRKISDYITNLNVILISPEDVDIIKKTPSDRRNLLNIAISQISKKYIEMNNEYNKLLKMRNDYLKMLYTNSFSDSRYFDILTEKLVDRATYIYIERNRIINLINEKITEIYKNITNIDNLKIKYDTNIEINNFDEFTIKEKLLLKFKENFNKEVNLGMTLYGPHRDDLIFTIEDNDLKYFGSQGQQKLSIIALKLALLLIYESITGYKPILLLDDIFSELDRTKKNNLIYYIQTAGQVIITTNDIRDINKKLLINAKILQVKNKKIIEKGEKK